MFDYETNPFDEGTGSEPAVSDAAEAAAAVEDAAAIDASSGEEPAAETAAAPAAEKSENTGTQEGEKVLEKADEAGKEEAEEEKSAEELLADVDKEIADEKHPKWFRERLKAVKTAFLNETNQVKSSLEPLEQFGKPEKLVDDLEIMKGLDAFENDPETQLPRATVKPFVERLVAKRGIETGVAVMRELSHLPSPHNEGWTLQHEVFASSGLDPTRIEDFKTFAKNGYQLQGVGDNPPPTPEELERIPLNLREAFVSLNPEQRDRILFLDDDMIELSLGGVQTKIDQERAQREADTKKAEDERAATNLRQQELYREIHERTEVLLDESGSRLFDSFTESLVNAEVDRFDAIAIANALSMVLNSNGVEGRQTRAALAEIGVTLDPGIDTLFKEWMEAGQRAAAFEKRNDQTNYRKTMESFEDLEQKLIRKANPIVAGIIQHRAGREAARIEDRNQRIDGTRKANTGLTPSAGTPKSVLPPVGGRTDFSEEAWEERNPFA